MSKEKGISRRKFLKLALGASAAASVGELLWNLPENELVLVDEIINNKVAFPPLPSEEKKTPGMASINFSKEFGGDSEVYSLMRRFPFIGFRINGQEVINVFGEDKPSVIGITPLEIKYGPDGKPFWDPDPNNVSSFVLPPQSISKDFSGNCLFIHNYSLIPFGIYKGVYRSERGKVLVGNKGAYCKDTRPIGVLRYPLSPNAQDEIIFYGKKQDQFLPDLENQRSFKCVEADIMSANAANELVVNKSDPDILYVMSCYPPEWSRIDEPPPGRVLMVMEKS
jgi:hypothetical protein